MSRLVEKGSFTTCRICLDRNTTDYIDLYISVSLKLVSLFGNDVGKCCVLGLQDASLHEGSSCGSFCRKMSHFPCSPALRSPSSHYWAVGQEATVSISGHLK